MTKTLTLMMVTLAVLALVVVAVAEETQTAPPPATTTGTAQRTPAGVGGAHAQGQGGGGKAGGLMAQGYLKDTPEAKAAWEKLGQLQLEMNQQQWELYVLFNAPTVDREAVKAKFLQMRDLTLQIKTTREKLQPFWTPFPEGMKPAKAGHGRTRKNGQQPTTPATTTPAA